MPWGLAAAAVGAVGSIVASDNASSSADKATDAQTGIANGQTALGRDQLKFNQRVYDEGAPARAAGEKRAGDISDAQLKGMQFATDQAKDYQGYNVGTFRPVEKALVTDAQGYDTRQRRTDAAAAAQADVDQSFNATRAAGERDLERSGIAPGSGKAMALATDAGVAQAAARAGAGTMAVRNVEQQGHARMVDAASLGRGLPASQATQQQIASTTGTGSASNAMQAITAQQSGVPNVNTGFNGAVLANNSAGNLFGSAAGTWNGVANSNAAGIGQLGRAVGSWAGSPTGSSYLSSLFAPSVSQPLAPDGSMYPPSDVNVKSGTGKKADPDAALAEINATPVETGWRYDPSKGGPDDGGQPHTGPMAQSVKRHMGEAAAPGGKKLSLVDMNGKMLAGMQALTSRVKQLEKRAA